MRLTPGANSIAASAAYEANEQRLALWQSLLIAINRIRGLGGSDSPDPSLTLARRSKPGVSAQWSPLNKVSNSSFLSLAEENGRKHWPEDKSRRAVVRRPLEKRSQASNDPHLLPQLGGKRMKPKPHKLPDETLNGRSRFVTGLRSNILEKYYEDKATPRQRTYASTVSGGVAGGVVTRLMGGRLAPGLAIFSLLGCIGQASYNTIDQWQLKQANTPSKPFLDRMAESKWIPLKSLSDDEYRHILSEKLLSVEAEIALIDDKIEELERDKLVETKRQPTEQGTQ
ncbi:hypothetical protein BJY00DRAFT_314450 [Aspergillus carlsbadensis]|nr:hypothetical protein BJY00DRAFT_314450 [Aspergillus carlsbadensis]